MTDPRPDGEVISASMVDSEIFGVVFERYADDIFRFVSRRVGRADAAEITGDVFARAFALRDRFDRTHVSARPWLYGIATNVVGDHLRRSEVRRRRFRTAAIRLLGRETDPFDRVDEDLDARSLKAGLDMALAGLSNDERDVLLLFSLEGLTYAEIGDALGVPIGTVRSRMARARRRMRELLPPDAQTMLRAFDEGEEP